MKFARIPAGVVSKTSLRLFRWKEGKNHQPKALSDGVFFKARKSMHYYQPGSTPCLMGARAELAHVFSGGVTDTLLQELSKQVGSLKLPFLNTALTKEGIKTSLSQHCPD
ncbi:hypothetical protein RRG08_016256 [Elysia crispata]|uniref:Uncharacterized protein n=1 Tax=Elysia crispata TaxID=231223 RepID=A0AAE1AKS9_9GAST|nr:hypothetical protein RRG08_016256 [Elysia crispata]